MNHPALPQSEHLPSAFSLEDLLAKLEREAALESDSNMQIVMLKEAEILFSQGDESDGLYVVLAGVLGVQVTQKDGQVREIDRVAPGATVGEMALLSGQKRAATVYAINEAKLLHLTREKFNQLSEEEVHLLLKMDNTIVARWRRLELSKVLHNLFGEMDANSLHTLQAQLLWRNLTNGQVLFHEGDTADGMYIVINGRLRAIATTPDGQATEIGEIAAGELVGEMALLTNEPRSATIIAVRQTNVVHMSKAIFEQLTRERPEWMAKLALMIVQRQQRSIKQIKRVAASGLTIALMPASPEADIRQFAEELASAMAPFGKTLLLDKAAFNQKYGNPGTADTPTDDPANPGIVAFMMDLDAENDFLFYLADGSSSVWTNRCISQSDRVLIVANPESDPTPSQVEQTLSQRSYPVRTELVLWHPASTKMPTGTIKWLKERTIHAHHHVRQGDAAHMQRLARRIAGHAVGVVLSGGSARGFAHLGVHRALEELNIPVDFIGATSMGAVMGAGFQIVEKHADLLNLASRFANPKAIFDRTLPFTSIMASNKVTKLMQTVYGDLQIEDCWIPFFCVASNLTTAEPVVLQTGPLWRAVRASLAIPGVFTPVMHEGDVLVDGGVMDNFPAQRMVELCESDCLIGVNVSPHQDKKRPYDFETGISGWRILLSRINPLTKPLWTPSLVGTLMRTMEINSVQRAKSEEALIDLMIYPDVKKFGMQAYDKYADIAQIGYEAALEPLRQWKKKWSFGQ